MSTAGQASAKVALIVVSYNNRDQLSACLDAVAGGEVVPGQVVVIENGDAQSAREAGAIVAAIGMTGQVVHCPDNPGYAGAINAGIDAAPDADAYWVLNPDTVATGKTLSAMLATLAAGHDIVGGRIVDRAGRIQSDGGIWRAWAARAVSINKGRTAAAALAPAAIAGRLDFAIGASFLFSRAALDRAGPFRADYFLYAEEVEWCVRAVARGARIGYAPDAVVLHDQGSSTGSAMPARDRPKLPIFLDERNKLNVVRDTSPGWFPVAVVASLALLTVRYGKSRAWPQLGYAVQGWWDGVLGRRGKPGWLTRR